MRMSMRSSANADSGISGDSAVSGLEALEAAHEAVSAHHGNNYLPLLDQHYRSHRSTLFTLVESIDLESANAERSVLDAVEYVTAQSRPRQSATLSGSSSAVTGQQGEPHGFDRSALKALTPLDQHHGNRGGGGGDVQDA